MGRVLTFHNKDFEKAVRDELLIFDRPITEEDALLACDLDCSEFVLDREDCQTLSAFKNLDWLELHIAFEDLSFLQTLENLEELCISSAGSYVDFHYLRPLKKLRDVTVCGENKRNIKLINLESLAQLPCLDGLTLYEFDTVDLAPLQNITQLRGFYCGHANLVLHAECISYLKNLISLTLVDIEIDSLNMLETFDDQLILGLYNLNIHNPTGLPNLSRFQDADFIEISVNGVRVI